MKIITQFKCCLGSNKRITGDILFLVRYLMPRSCLMWDRDNTPENTGAFEVLLYHTPPSNWCSSIIIPQAAKENNFPSRWDKVCILRHMHPGSWLNVESVWNAEMRFLLFSTWTMLLFNEKSKLSWAVRIHVWINAVKLVKDRLFLSVQIHAQWDRWWINRDVSALCFPCSLMWPTINADVLPGKSIFMLLMLPGRTEKRQHFHGDAEKL